MEEEIKREKYKDNSHTYKNICNRSNEPWFGKGEDLLLTKDDYTHYPNMYKVYELFSNIFGISTDNFILTSGVEESLRIAFTVANIIKGGHDNDVYLESDPSWGLSKIVAKQVFHDENKIHNLEYKLEENGHIGYALDRINDEIIYTTFEFNNFIRHDSLYYNNIGIYDETYTLLHLFHNTINSCPALLNNDKLSDVDLVNYKNKDHIIIGSFSKIYGAGFRLGYILFNDKYKDLFNLYRSQYINGLAVKLLYTIKKDLEELNSILDFHNFPKEKMNNLYVFYKLLNKCYEMPFNNLICTCCTSHVNYETISISYFNQYLESKSEKYNMSENMFESLFLSKVSNFEYIEDDDLKYNTCLYRFNKPSLEFLKTLGNKNLSDCYKFALTDIEQIKNLYS